jgi:hypothetical protein
MRVETTSKNAVQEFHLRAVAEFTLTLLAMRFYCIANHLMHTVHFGNLHMFRGATVNFSKNLISGFRTLRNNKCREKCRILARNIRSYVPPFLSAFKSSLLLTETIDPQNLKIPTLVCPHSLLLRLFIATTHSYITW